MLSYWKQETSVREFSALRIALNTSQVLERQVFAHGSNSDKYLITFCAGRNGGHLTPISFSGFSSVEARYGTQDALSNAALEEYVSSEIRKLSKERGWSEDIDLVINKRTVLLLTNSDEERAKRDYDHAQKAGLPLLDQIDWLEAEEVYRVSAY